MRRRMRAAALVLALALALGTVAAATNTTETTPKPIDYNTTTNTNAREKNGIQVAPLDSTNCTVTFAEGSEELNVTYTNKNLKKDDMVIVLLLKSDKAVTSDVEAKAVKPELTAGTIQYIDQADVTEAGTVTFRVFPQNYSNGVIRVIWKDQTSGGVNTATVAAVNRTYTLGDVDGDGSIDVSDAAKVLKYAVHLRRDGSVDEGYEIAFPEAADVDEDGSVDVSDAAKILKFAIKKIPFK